MIIGVSGASELPFNRYPTMQPYQSHHLPLPIVAIALLSLLTLALIRWHRRYTRRNDPTEVPARPLSAFVGTPGSLGGPRKSMMYWQSKASLSQYGGDDGPMAGSGSGPGMGLGMGGRTESLSSLTSRSYSDGQGYYGPGPSSPGLGNGQQYQHPMAIHNYSNEYLPQSPRSPVISFAQPGMPSSPVGAGQGARNLPYPPAAALDNRYGNGGSGRELERSPSPEDQTPTRHNHQHYQTDYERVPNNGHGSPAPVRTRIEQVEILQDESLAYLQHQDKRRSGAGYGNENSVFAGREEKRKSGYVDASGGEGRYSEKRLSFIPVIEVNDPEGGMLNEKRY